MHYGLHDSWRLAAQHRLLPALPGPPHLQVGAKRQEGAQGVGEAGDHAWPFCVAQRVLQLVAKLAPFLQAGTCSLCCWGFGGRGAVARRLPPQAGRAGAAARAAAAARGAATRANCWLWRSTGCSRCGLTGRLLDGRANAPLTSWLLRLMPLLVPLFRLLHLGGAAAYRNAVLCWGCRAISSCGRLPGPHWRAATGGALPTSCQLLQALGEVLYLSCILRCLLPQPPALLPCRRLLASEPLNLQHKHFGLCLCLVALFTRLAAASWWLQPLLQRLLFQPLTASPQPCACRLGCGQVSSKGAHLRMQKKFPRAGHLGVATVPG